MQRRQSLDQSSQAAAVIAARQHQALRLPSQVEETSRWQPGQLADSAVPLTHACLKIQWLHRPPPEFALLMLHTSASAQQSPTLRGKVTTQNERFTIFEIWRSQRVV